jgi:hypothetical protein
MSNKDIHFILRKLELAETHLGQALRGIGCAFCKLNVGPPDFAELKFEFPPGSKIYYHVNLTQPHCDYVKYAISKAKSEEKKLLDYLVALHGWLLDHATIIAPTLFEALDDTPPIMAVARAQDKEMVAGKGGDMESGCCYFTDGSKATMTEGDCTDMASHDHWTSTPCTKGGGEKP